jgi:nitroreductase
LDTLAKAGMAAPSAMNKQPWVFILINDRKTLNLMADSLPSAKMLYKAGGAIVVCGDQKKCIAGNELFWVEDCAAASQNILIAVESLEMGAVWTGVFPDNKKMATVRTILEIPSDVIPLNVIAIGYPFGKDVPKNKYKKENIHWNKW